MRRAIEVNEDSEGPMYEELRLFIVLPAGETEIEIPPELMDAIMDATDLGVNVGPNTEQSVNLRAKYVYDYWRAAGPAETAAP